MQIFSVQNAEKYNTNNKTHITKTIQINQKVSFTTIV